MSKPFNIHDWQAKQRQQRLDEIRAQDVPGTAAFMGKNMRSGGMSNSEKNKASVDAFFKDLRDKEENPVVAKGDGLEITQDEMEKLHKNGRVKLKNGSVLVYMKETVDEHHGDDFPKGLLKKSVDKFLDDLKKKSEKDYDKVEDIMKKHFNVGEASMTGTGASVTAGTGAAYATPKAFGDDKNKKKKAYMGYKKV